MKIAIIGGGISGCATYLLLKKHLHPLPAGKQYSITIYEAHDMNKDTKPSERAKGLSHSATLTVGGGLGVGPNGLGVLRRLDEEVLRDVVRGGYVTPIMIMKSKGGQVLVRANQGDALPPNAASEHAMSTVASSRHSIWRALRTRVSDNDIVIKRVSQVVANPDGPNTIEFVDGSPPIEADLIIGADGLKSRVKLALFPEAEKDPYPPRYEGLVGVGGFISASSVRDHVEKGAMNFVFGGNGFFGYFFSDSAESSPYRDSPHHIADPGERLAWWSTYEVSECPTTATIDKGAITRQLQERHKGWGDPVIQEILQSLEVDTMWPTWTVPPLPTWERDGVVLVGDAAHALPPTSGQGCSQALEDAEAFVLLLSHSLQNADQEQIEANPKSLVKTAARQYMALRVPHVTQILREAQKIQNSKREKGTISEYLMYGVLWIMSFFPNVMFKKQYSVFTYNVADEVKKMTDSM
ncbi:uncharacterized protein B0I36DRAFT_385263 [Microdochium trichocladiopsis]|uniref:FAD-binding domain-containing protein n=1 Tax=Microdochium trichocladiopsis TaxID=1682393 RepID=A0A9P9BMZ1_9PEZI|nr:uncharacterized protein B0I36DRAFT_385263 [Microdochium trichocladiopsis]KAH7027188.1 hypothetical protein B0I36DRAFT_385263 [Microdochium trichocladiopsis]